MDQLFNSSEQRLARALLLLAHFGTESKPETVIAKINQETLAEMICATRSRISFFMNKFRKLSFIDYTSITMVGRVGIATCMCIVLSSMSSFFFTRGDGRR